MIRFSELALRRGEKVLFEQATCQLPAGWRIGLTGANGSGKSSLFALLRGQLGVDAGDCVLPADAVIAHVRQETEASERPAIEYVIDGDAPLRRVLADIESCAEDAALPGLYEQLDALDGYSANARAARLLHGLGFAAEEYTRPVSTFSGGWRMRLNLAQALMCRSDILLLDEPTNHLDLEAVLWLEGWLKKYPGTLWLISHDRDFLDQAVDHILHIEQQQLRLYTGNYSAFEKQRAEALSLQQSMHDKQQREIAHLNRFVERFRYKASKAKQAQSRLKTLEKMDLIARAHVDNPFRFEFAACALDAPQILQLDGVRAGYGDRVVLDGLNWHLSSGDRIGLLGQNGVGKSTLIKLLAGALAPMLGEVQPNRKLKVGYFAQHQLELLHAEESPLQHLQQLDGQAGEQALRNFLGGFGFHGDAAEAPVAPFSGGEKARLVLALLVYQRPNLLLLDEPTNHLDLNMRQALTRALNGFDGALVLVSHDRHLLQSVCDELWLVDAGQVQPFDGNLDDYRRLIRTQRNTAEADDASAPALKAERKVDRKEARALKNRVQKLERVIESTHSELSAVEAELADPALYQNDQANRLSQLHARQQQLKGALDAAEAEWLECSEALES